MRRSVPAASALVPDSPRLADAAALPAIVSALWSPEVLGTLAALAVLLAWDAGGFDILVAGWSATHNGFPLRSDGFLLKVMHEGGKAASWLLMLALLAAIRWPVGLWRRLALHERGQAAGAALLSLLAISLLKHASTTSCPWDLQVFGGVARYVSHWSWQVLDGGPGHCFPAGHASAAFAYLGLYFATRRSAPAAALRILAGVTLVGLALGLGQQLRGAHYMSHTLWTAWICWTISLSVDIAVRAWSSRHAVRRASSGRAFDAKLNDS